MTGRSITAGAEAAFAESNFRPVLFARFDFDGGTLRVTNNPVTLKWDSESWLGLGRLGAIDEVREGADIEAMPLSFLLSGLEEANFALALTEHYMGRKARAWLALYDASYQLVDAPILFFRGRMMNIEELPEQNALRLNCEGRLADLFRPRVRRYTHEDQQLVYPDDLGLQYVPDMVSKTLNWGVPGAPK